MKLKWLQGDPKLHWFNQCTIPRRVFLKLMVYHEVLQRKQQINYIRQINVYCSKPLVLYNTSTYNKVFQIGYKWNLSYCRNYSPLSFWQLHQNIVEVYYLLSAKKYFRFSIIRYFIHICLLHCVDRNPNLHNIADKNS